MERLDEWPAEVEFRERLWGYGAAQTEITKANVVRFLRESDLDREWVIDRLLEGAEGRWAQFTTIFGYLVAALDWPEWIEALERRDAESRAANPPIYDHRYSSALHFPSKFPSLRADGRFWSDRDQLAELLSSIERVWYAVQLRYFDAAQGIGLDLEHLYADLVRFVAEGGLDRGEASEMLLGFVAAEPARGGAYWPVGLVGAVGVLPGFDDRLRACRDSVEDLDSLVRAALESAVEISETPVSKLTSHVRFRRRIMGWEGGILSRSDS